MKYGFFDLIRPYLVLDIETTGIYPAQGHILQIGLYFYSYNTDPIQRTFFIKQPEEVLNAYDNSEYVRKRKEEGNEGYIKSSDVRDFGLSPKVVFKYISKVIELAQQERCFIVGHNLITFDIPWLEYHSLKNGFPLKFTKNNIFDTGAVYKALKAGLVPGDEEEPWEFFKRVKDTRIVGLHWNLAHCAREFDLIKEDEASKAHDAQYDVLLTAKLFESLRKQFLKSEPSLQPHLQPVPPISYDPS